MLLLVVRVAGEVVFNYLVPERNKFIIYLVSLQVLRADRVETGLTTVRVQPNLIEVGPVLL